MWPFDYFKKKKGNTCLKNEPKETYAQKIELKKYYLERKEHVDSILMQIRDKEVARQREAKDKKIKSNKLHNSTCPICKSTNIIHVFRQTKTTTSGNFDTFKVNKCSECGNEWEHKDEQLFDFVNLDYGLLTTFFIDRVYRMVEHVATFDPTNLTETYETVEECIQHESARLLDTFSLEPIQDITIEVLSYYAYRHSHYLLYEDNILEGDRKTRKPEDAYLKNFKPEMETALIEWFGFKKYFNK